MRNSLKFSLITVFLVACAERPRLPTEIGIFSNEPSVANEVDEFSFEIGAEAFFYSASYPLEFNSEVVILFVEVSNYSSGTGTLVLNGEGNNLIFTHSLSNNQNQQFRLSGSNVPSQIQLKFNNYQGQVNIRLEPVL
jgi:hypothetical protein